MRRVLTACVCAGLVGLAGCGRLKATRARHGSPPETGRAQSTRPSRSTELSFRGLDLSTAQRTTRPGELPDLWEECPAGSSSFEIRRDVICSYMGLDGTVYSMPTKNRFYVQKDPVGSSTLTFYGPFEGDPREILGLSESDVRPIHAEPVAD